MTLDTVRYWLDKIEIRDPKLALLLCKLIPASCPFARTIQLVGHTLFRIPPMCKLNPFYDQLMGLRFQALSFLAEECSEEVVWR